MKSPAIPQDEHDIMNEAYRFLRDHNNPPPIGTDTCVSYWERTARDIGDLVGGKWDNHPLAKEIGLALYSYLEHKCKSQS